MLLPLAMRLTALTLLLPSLAFADPALLMTGSFHGNEVRVRSGETFLSLEVNGAEARLVKRTVDILPVFDPFQDEGDQTSGKKVQLRASTAEPLVLLAGLPLKEGTLQHVPLKPWTALTPGTRVSLQLGGREWTLSAHATSEPPDAHGYVVYRDYRLVLSDGRTEQVLATYEGLDDAVPALRFAGDLDGDGALDLVLDTTWHYNLSRPAVFLSSQAKPGELVYEAASMRSVGC